MRGAYLQLLLKEAKQALGTAVVFTLIIAALLAYLISRVGAWPVELVIGLMASLVGFVPFWALWRSYYSLRQEWSGDHMYLLLSLPIPGWYITSAKLLLTLIEVLVYVLLIQGASLLVLNMDTGTTLFRDLVRDPAFLSTAVRLSLLSAAGLLIGMVVVQFSYLCGRLVSRRRGLMTLLVAFVSFWLVLRTGTWLSPLLQWIPPLPVHGVNIMNGSVHVTTANIGVAPLLGSLLASLLLFLLASTLLERDIEL